MEKIELKMNLKRLASLAETITVLGSALSIAMVAFTDLVQVMVNIKEGSGT